MLTNPALADFGDDLTRYTANTELRAEQKQEIRRLQLIWEMREHKFPCLYNQGFVRLVDASGSDDRIVEAARLTAQSVGATFDSDRGLLRYLMRHRHTTPLEFGEITLHIRCPMDLWRQWIRHRTASVNEYSTRYSPAIDETAKTRPNNWRCQSKQNRQGSSGDYVQTWPEGVVLWPMSSDGDLMLQGVLATSERPTHKGWAVIKHVENDPDPDRWCDVLAVFENMTEAEIDPGVFLSHREDEVHKLTREVYDQRIAFGVANEQARKDLTLSTFTEAYWKIDLHNLFHFLGLRMDSHAQAEIRQYANVIGHQIVRTLFPVAWEAFLDYRLNAELLSSLDILVIQRMVVYAGKELMQAPYPQHVFMACQDPGWQPLKKCRERVECWNKLQKLGLVSRSEANPVLE